MQVSMAPLMTPCVCYPKQKSRCEDAHAEARIEALTQWLTQAQRNI